MVEKYAFIHSHTHRLGCGVGNCSEDQKHSQWRTKSFLQIRS